MSTSHLVIRAGERAAQRLRAEGFHADLFGTLVGASGGPKWLVLRHLDAVVIDRVILPRQRPLNTLGSSIGSFRHACLAQNDPHAALARFESSYVEQVYEGPGHPTMDEISAESDRILTHFLGDTGAAEIEANERVRSHVVATRLRRDRGRDRGAAFQLQLGLAASRNALSRRLLGRSFIRLVFGPEKPGISFADPHTRQHRLTRENLRHALLASGSIPLLMAGVRDTPGVPGTLFDGGLIDYHFDFSFARPDGLVLYPHFFDRITPGWFDKPFGWRRPHVEDLDDVVMIAPSDAFIASLPGAKVPDRNDFLELTTEVRLRRWREILDRCRCLAEELAERIETQRIADCIVPFRA